MIIALELLRRAAEAIRAAAGIIITAGAGMGVDSGLPDFRGSEGFWKAYPPFAKRGLSFEDLANPQWFERDPALAWGFYGHRFELYRRTAPHEGFALLRRWAEAKPHGYFVFTSNVDGHFQKAGFPDERVYECHGSLQHLQCVRPCCAATWPAPEDLHLEIDPATLRAGGELPRCVRCGGLARPNVLMFEDDTWSPGRASAQQVRFRAWLRSLARGQFAVIELGAGTAVPTVRHTAEQLASAGRVPLIRINPQETEGPPNGISLMGSALAVLQELATMLA
jgi:NAD-dependent SIR2 family protein deacetylase